MDWRNRFPYLVPVWHSLADKNLSNHSKRIVDPNYEVDFGGIGTFNDVWFRHQRPIPFRIRRPPLPFHLAGDDRRRSVYASRNCLAYDPGRKVLIAAKDDRIEGFHLSISKQNDEMRHEFATGLMTVAPKNPFAMDIVERWHHKVSIDRNILDLRFYQDDDEIQVMAHSRPQLAIFRYRDKPEDGHLSPMLTIYNGQGNYFPSADSLLDVWDRNPEFPEEFIATFIDDPQLYRWNVERETSTVEATIMDDISKPKNRFIAVEYLKNLNPFLYVFGTHQKISLGDHRLGSDGTGLLTVIDVKNFEFFHPFEMFQAILLNPFECHQFIAASDFNITFFDLRYPNKNLFQCKHMITGNLVNKLVATNYRTATDSGNQAESLLLLASNNVHTALLSFDCKLAVQPSMLHVPFYLTPPLEINKYFPFETNPKLIFPRGIQLLTSDPFSEFFSAAFLMNNGDIFMQDFWPVPAEDVCPPFRNLDEFKYENHVGSPIPLSQDFEPIVKEYMESVMEHVQKIKTSQSFKPVATMESNPDCKKCGRLLNLFHERPIKDRNYHQLQCSDNSVGFCACTSETDPEELLLLQEDDDQLDSTILSTENSQVIVDRKLRLFDGDPIDFELIRAGWRKTVANPNEGIQNHCRPLTQKLFNLWCPDDVVDVGDDGRGQNAIIKQEEAE